MPAESMQAAVYRSPRELRIESLPLPEIGAEEVLVEVSHCGICGTDLHLVLEGMGRPDSVGGHEWSGTIVATGPGVDGWAKGDTVVGGGRPGCGRCARCRDGRPSLCLERPPFGSGDPLQGAFAEYIRVPVSELHRIPLGLDLRVAALTEPLAVALHAVTLSRVVPGDRALVTGAGPLGLLVIAALRAHGVEDVRVSEPAPRRLEQAGKVGATKLLIPDELETPPMPFVEVDDPVDVALECSGQPAAMQSALAQLRKMGRLVLVGTGMRRPKFDHNRILMNELVVTGAYNYDAGGFERALELLASDRLPTDQLIEPLDVGLDDLFGALEGLERGELAAKVLVNPREK